MECHIFIAPMELLHNSKPPFHILDSAFILGTPKTMPRRHKIITPSLLLILIIKRNKNIKAIKKIIKYRMFKFKIFSDESIPELKIFINCCTV
jgi:hypothetical protein